MTRLYFVRHGDAYDEDGVQLEDYPLNNYGKIQSLQLARRLKENVFDAMYCSKIPRSMQTAEIVNEEHGMDIIYSCEFNEVGNDSWPQPGVMTGPVAIKDFERSTNRIYKVYNHLLKKHHDQEVIIFTHGNWIRVLLTKILADGDPKIFCHFVIHNTALNIIDVDENGYEYIISISDAAHTKLYGTRI